MYSLGVFLGPHLQYMEVPRLGVTLEPQLLAYTTATALRDLSHICRETGTGREREEEGREEGKEKERKVSLSNEALFKKLLRSSRRGAVVNESD